MDFDSWVEKHLPRTLFQFGKYSGLGLLTLLVNLFVTILLTEKLGLLYLHSAIIGYVCGITVGFFLHKYVTFKNKEHKFVREVPLFIFTYVIGILINTGAVYIFVEVGQLLYQPAVLFSGMISGLSTFCLNKWVVFRR
jgi:putative flippase GtrA